MTGEWRTSDITLAAFLKLYVPLRKTEWDRRNNGSWECFWVFDDTDELADLVSEFVGGRASANLKLYNSTIAELKHQMYDELNARRQATS